MKLRVEILSYTKRWEFEVDFYTSPVIFLCPTCNQIWARISHESFAATVIREAPCEKCPPAPYPYDRQNVPGSLVWCFFADGVDLFIDDLLIAKLPLELQQREFNLHVKALEAEQNGNATESEYLRSNPGTDFKRYFVDPATYWSPRT